MEEVSYSGELYVSWVGYGFTQTQIKPDYWDPGDINQAMD